MSLAPIFRDLTGHCLEGQELSQDQVREAVEALVQEGGSEELELKAEFLQVLGGKGESAGEIAAFVEALLAKAVRPAITFAEGDAPVIDVVGTGGDRLGLFNVSSSALFVIAAAGVGVIKHGNRGITSKSGGADVLEALGAQISLGPEEVARCFEATGIAFIFAPLYHPAFKAIAPVRKMLAERGIPTIFNKLGPLLNPAQPPYQLAGVYTETLMPSYASVLAGLGRRGAWVVHGRVPDGEGMLGADELTPLGPNLYQPVTNGVAGECQEIPAHDLPAMQSCTLTDLQGTNGQGNAALMLEILAGRERGPRRDVTLLNAAAGLVITGKAATLKEAYALAGDLVDNGAALAKLEAFRTFRI